MIGRHAAAAGQLLSHPASISNVVVDGPLGDITADGLTTALQSAGALSTGRCVTQLVADHIDGSYLSKLVRLTVEYDQPADSAPASLVGKFPAPNEQVREIAKFMGRYAREVHFYKELAQNARIQLPICYLAHVDAEGGSFQLLLEDIRGGVVHDQNFGCDRDDAQLALTQAAQLHAAYWRAAILDGIGWLNRMDQAWVHQWQAWQAMYAGAWRDFVTLDGVDLSPDQVAIGDSLANSDLARWMCQHDSPLTLVHSDFHLGNLLYVGSGRERQVFTVDWQIVAHAPAIIDVAVFLERMPTLTRRSLERDLVAEYHRALCSSGVTDYSWGQCWSDYQRWTWYGVLNSVMAATIKAPTLEDLPSHTRSIARGLDQIADHDAVRFLR